ncbi:MAG: hypothetical protein IKP71_10285, partial [Candidatus Riflebacteria bacterium]|nr:hypothetical protein [Candidatus Riflebacteria bacterium]
MRHRRSFHISFQLRSDSKHHCTEQSDLENLLNKLDNELRLITVLYYYDDLSVKHIAKVLDIPEGTVKSRLSRAR